MLTPEQTSYIKEMNYSQDRIQILQKEISDLKAKISVKEKELKIHKANVKSFPKVQSYNRLGIVPSFEIMPLIPSEKISVLGTKVKCKSLRLRTFKENSTCCSCGITGTFFAVERIGNQDNYHINFYAKNEYDNDILMTRDHIQPLSKGGPDTLENSQTMCYICNELKGNKE